MLPKGRRMKGVSVQGRVVPIQKLGLSVTVRNTQLRVALSIDFRCSLTDETCALIHSSSQAWSFQNILKGIK